MTPAIIAFYATAATVIPVLFLAIAVQGDTYNGLLRAADTATRRVARTRGAPLRQRAIVSLTALVPLLIGELIVGTGALGEIWAISTLYHQKDSPLERGIVFGATSFLILALFAGPAQQFLKSYSETFAEVIRLMTGKGHAEQHRPADAGAGETPQP